MLTDRELIEQIKQIRERNNGNWMLLLQLAFEIAPDRAREVFRDIVYCDGQVQVLSKQLAQERKPS